MQQLAAHLDPHIPEGPVHWTGAHPDSVTRIFSVLLSISPLEFTSVCHRRPCLVPLLQQGCRTVGTCPLEMSRSSRLFGLIKRGFIQCLKKGHTHNRNIMFHSDWQYRRFACTAAFIVLRFCGAFSPPPPFGGESSCFTMCNALLLGPFLSTGEGEDSHTRNSWRPAGGWQSHRLFPCYSDPTFVILERDTSWGGVDIKS